MATLLDLRTSAQVVLSADHTVGRSRTSRLVVDGDLASSHHAALRWTGECWELRDLGSRNGTWLANQRLIAGESRALTPGLTMAFGDPAARWRVEDVDPPTAIARDGRGATRVAEDGLLLLPDASAPELCVQEDGEGRWFAEPARGSGEPRRVEDGDQVSTQGGLWHLWLPTTVYATFRPEDGAPLRLDEATLCLAVSADEEHVELRLLAGERALVLPHRAHTYLLLTLARARLADSADHPDAPDSELGWVYQDELAKSLRIPEEQFNVSIYRARRQLARARVIGADGLVERRRGAGQIRLGAANVRIDPL